jgi:endogenous inhibitor of DNA gyrase (YacG/DUF329 family)
MNCPVCRKPVALGDPEAPFCSERCRLIDLGRWADGSYVISSPLEPGGTVAREERESDEE